MCSSCCVVEGVPLSRLAVEQYQWVLMEMNQRDREDEGVYKKSRLVEHYKELNQTRRVFLLQGIIKALRPRICISLLIRMT